MGHDRFDEIIGVVLSFEGGVSNHPNDSGGLTNMGITQTVYDGYRKEAKLLPRSVRDITLLEAKDIYKKKYWAESRAQYLRPPLDLVVFDTAVNFGVGRSNQFLGEALGLKPSTKWQADISNQIHEQSATDIAFRVIALRMEWRGRKVVEKAVLKDFLAGWLNRDRRLFNMISNGQY